MRALLVTGGTGQVGTELKQKTWPAGYELHFPTRAELDLSDSRSINAYLEGKRFDAIINSGAYTAVDKAETEVALAWTVNALAPAILAEYAGRAEIPMIQLSTDYVFDGRKDGPYVEDDPVAPLNVYGASKEGGEQAVRTAARQHVILRTSWVVSPHGRNFVKTILRLVGEKPGLDVVSDQIGVPTSAADIAEALSAIIARLFRPEAYAGRYGTFQFCAAGATTWCEIATVIAAIAAERGLGNCHVRPIKTQSYPTPAKRPLNSRLDTTKIGEHYGIRPREWRVALEEVLEELLSRSARR